MVVSVSIEGQIAYVTIDNPPVNAASHAVRQGLIDAVAETDKCADVRAVVLMCEGRTFVAGADVREFGKPPLEPHLPDVVLAIEGAWKPWIAVIHGTALGGGLEIALGCHYRIADQGAKMGLPEVNLGLIPGAGGTVRLPRLIGPIAALDMIAKGKSVTAAAALKSGLIDHIESGDLRNAAIAFTKTATMVVPLSQRQVPPYDADEFDRHVTMISQKSRGQNSPVAACLAVKTAITLPAKKALISERDAFLTLKEDPQSLALRHIFFAERGAAKIGAIQDTTLPKINGVGVIGGGTMGAGIAAACLLAGLETTMIERDMDALTAGLNRVSEILSNSLNRGLITGEKHASIAAAFHGATDYAALGTVDLVVEAVFEDMDTKHAVFTALDKATKPDAVLASNTSYLDITQIAQVVDDPSRVIGLHFFAPAHIMKLLELVVPDDAAPMAIAMGVALGKRLRKITVPAGVCDGFIGNRIMSAYRRACEYMIEDGAMPLNVDAAMRGFGFPMGIFEMQDLAGNDISWAMRKRQAATRDPSLHYVAIADKLCEMGRFGRKTGAGWYSYEDKTAKADPIVTALIEAESALRGITRRTFLESEIMDEILGAMQHEGAQILAEGIAARPEDIDVVMVNGYGFPRWRGGPMFLKDNPAGSY
jgi:3-hydroxyacyl-CoA dehydrogenase